MFYGATYKMHQQRIPNTQCPFSSFIQQNNLLRLAVKNIKNDEAAQYRLNEKIRVPEVRLVGDNFEAISAVANEKIEANVYPTQKVLRWAFALELDLVEISPNAKPPVCRITDFQKFLYQKRKKEKEIKSNTVKTVLKEIRFGPNTDEHDFEFKTKHAESFLAEGSKVKAYVQFPGRTIVFKDRGETLLKNFIARLADLGTPEAPLKLEGRRMMVVLTPKKVAVKKKEEPKVEK